VDIENKKKPSLIALVWALMQHYLIDIPNTTNDHIVTPPDPEEELLEWAYTCCSSFGMKRYG
jgi:hypothetical protein